MRKWEVRLRKDRRGTISKGTDTTCRDGVSSAKTLTRVLGEKGVGGKPISFLYPANKHEKGDAITSPKAILDAMLVGSPEGRKRGCRGLSWGWVRMLPGIGGPRSNQCRRPKNLQGT